ncbi:MAG: SMC-Scp complex subunit ScpB [Dongiaceae bacterium]
MSEDRFQLQRLLEAILFASSEPLTVDALTARMPEGADIAGLLQEIRDLYANRGVNLTPVEGRWCFRTAADLSSKFNIEQKVERKLTRAAVETMAIVAYHQPVTRAEIEEIRGVAISKGTLDNLLEAGWIKPKGRRQTPGRPVTWVTTEGFLEHFGLESCDALPGVEELRAAGLLDSRNNSATLGVQGTLPPGADSADDEDDDDEQESGIADEEYEADVLARLEGTAGERASADAASPDEPTDQPVAGGEAVVDGGELDEAELDDAGIELAALDGVETVLQSGSDGGQSDDADDNDEEPAEDLNGDDTPDDDDDLDDDDLEDDDLDDDDLEDDSPEDGQDAETDDAATDDDDADGRKDKVHKVN